MRSEKNAVWGEKRSLVRSGVLCGDSDQELVDTEWCCRAEDLVFV